MGQIFKFQKMWKVKNAIFEGPNWVGSRPSLISIGITFWRPQSPLLNEHTLSLHTSRERCFWDSSKSSKIASWVVAHDEIFEVENRSNQVCSGTSQTSLMPPIDRSRRDLSIGGIRLVWEVWEHTWLERSLKFEELDGSSGSRVVKIDEDLMVIWESSRVVKIWESSRVVKIWESKKVPDFTWGYPHDFWLSFLLEKAVRKVFEKSIFLQFHP